MTRWGCLINRSRKSLMYCKVARIGPNRARVNADFYRRHINTYCGLWYFEQFDNCPLHPIFSPFRLLPDCNQQPKSRQLHTLTLTLTQHRWPLYRIGFPQTTVLVLPSGWEQIDCQAKCIGRWLVDLPETLRLMFKKRLRSKKSWGLATLTRLYGSG